jgi:hypothetical protein
MPQVGQLGNFTSKIFPILPPLYLSGVGSNPDFNERWIFISNDLHTLKEPPQVNMKPPI